MKLFYLIALLVLIPLSAGAQGNFETLTNLPLFEDINADGGASLSEFFNRIYVLSVGAAAIIAVAQIMIAGFKWATAGGSHSAIEQSRELIRNSVLGLLLVLAPTIVFGLINPDILSLRINTSELERNQVEEVEFDQNAGTAPLAKNSLGAYDDVCDFKHVDAGFQVYRNLSLNLLGENDPRKGRTCCRLVDGEIIENESGGACDLSSLIDGDRWAAHVEVEARVRVVQQNGIPTEETQKLWIDSVGANPQRFWVDIDMIAIHGFRSQAQCDQFRNSPPSTLLARLSERPEVGLVFAQNTFAQGVRPQDIIAIERVVSSNCGSRIDYNERTP